jgi:hypothetical protein
LLTGFRLYFVLITVTAIGGLRPWMLTLNPREKAYFLPHTRMSLVTLVLLLIFYKRARIWTDKLAQWANVAEDVYARRVVMSVGIFIFSSMHLMFHAGFWFPGIGGWTYEKLKSKVQPSFENESVQSPVPDFLMGAVATDNARFLTSVGFITGKAIFLHYANGKILPANQELLGAIPFPQYIYGAVNDVERYDDAYKKSFAITLKNYSFNRKFILPLTLAYPNHAVYNSINYQTFPDPNLLRSISFWNLTLHIMDDRTVSIVAASKVKELVY